MVPRLCVPGIGQWVVFRLFAGFVGVICVLASHMDFFLSIKKRVSVNEILQLKNADRERRRAYLFPPTEGMTFYITVCRKYECQFAKSFGPFASPKPCRRNSRGPVRE